MKSKVVLRFCLFFLVVALLTAANADAQTVAYRQTDLASNVPRLANNTAPSLINPWGIAFLPGQPFFLAENGLGLISSHDATGVEADVIAIPVPPGDTRRATPTAIASDTHGFFGPTSAPFQFVVVTEDGTISGFSVANGAVPSIATLTSAPSPAGAVFTGLALLNPACCQLFVAVANFNNGFIHTFTGGFDLLSLAPLVQNAFVDPGLPAGYSPFNIQLIGNQVFVTYAVQDAAKHDPVEGAGNGIVNIFNQDGTFVRRFATGGLLDAPWGVTQASANFGPFSNDILIGNVGDGAINAFDPTTGNFVGQIKTGDGIPINNMGLHALTFRSDGFGDPNTLYLTAGIANGADGVFATITPGLVSTTRVSAPATPANTSFRITATVSAGPGNPGNPTGSVNFLDGSNPLGTATLVNGTATLDAVLTGVRIHTIVASYNGDAAFLASTANSEVQVTGVPTTLSLTAPANAAPGAPVQLMAKINAQAGMPTGQIMFQDGTSNLGTTALDASGTATLTVSTLAPGQHTLTASYAGDTTFASSMSPAVTVNIANADFSFGATPMSATVMAGQSAQFMLSVTPAGGFANNVSFTCSPITGITCTFNPTTVITTNGAAVSTTLTVTTSASVPRYGLLPLSLIGPGSLLAALVLFGLLLSRMRKLQSARASWLTATAVLVVAGLSLALGGCGGYGSGSTQPNRGTASIMVTAQSGSISHAASVSVTVQ